MKWSGPSLAEVRACSVIDLPPVISGDGEWLGTVEAPPKFRILDVVGGLVLGVQLDEMDVENVVVYELRPV